MGTKHTGGEWEAELGGMHGNSWSVMCDDGPICHIGNSSPKDESNAHLIAAAPDLLKACEETHSTLEIMMETINSHKSLDDFREYAAAVVASTRASLVPAIALAQGGTR